MRGIKIRLIDINNFSVAEEIDFDIHSEIVKEIEENIEKLSYMGITFEIAYLQIIDTTKFFNFVLKRLFPYYKIEDNQGKGGGMPDFRLIFDNQGKEVKNSLASKHYLFDEGNFIEELFVEVKKNNDGLHYSQIEWILKERKRKRIFILFINEDKKNG